MATPKRRVKKNRPHQHLKGADSKNRGVNWLQVAAIVVGLIIVASMVLSMVVTPGTF